jgi:hypothetical protein
MKIFDCVRHFKTFLLFKEKLLDLIFKLGLLIRKRPISRRRVLKSRRDGAYLGSGSTTAAQPTDVLSRAIGLSVPVPVRVQPLQVVNNKTFYNDCLFAQMI